VATISVSETNLKIARVPVTAIPHPPYKNPHITLKHCSAEVFPSGGVRGVGVWGDTLLRTGLNTLIHSLGG
jgi:hypothetical protein